VLEIQKKGGKGADVDRARVLAGSAYETILKSGIDPDSAREAIAVALEKTVENLDDARKLAGNLLDSKPIEWDMTRGIFVPQNPVVATVEGGGGTLSPDLIPITGKRGKQGMDDNGQTAFAD
jgi:hypothetical protein